MTCFHNYLLKVNPTLMDVESQRVLKKYFYCIVDEVESRMEEYREFDKIYLDEQVQQSVIAKFSFHFILKVCYILLSLLTSHAVKFYG